jgi:hypothetical protein
MASPLTSYPQRDLDKEFLIDEEAIKAHSKLKEAVRIKFTPTRIENGLGIRSFKSRAG